MRCFHRHLYPPRLQVSSHWSRRHIRAARSRCTAGTPRCRRNAVQALRLQAQWYMNCRNDEDVMGEGGGDGRGGEQGTVSKRTGPVGWFAIETCTRKQCIEEGSAPRCRIEQGVWQMARHRKDTQETRGKKYSFEREGRSLKNIYKTYKVR